MEVSLVLDILLALLLVGTIGVALKLHRQLGSLRSDREQFETLAASFSQATNRAEDGIGKLKIASEDLSRLCAKAGSLKEDLNYLVERADTSADRLEGCVRAAKKTDGSPVSVPLGDSADNKRAPKPAPRKRQSEVERNLLKALGMAEARDQAIDKLSQS
ncbi:MAG: hypothetical protein H6905_01710 [Hyphomicrobiales bacterium]|nr:hypothetical protein [Hyphomicrobiales bacterium]